LRQVPGKPHEFFDLSINPARIFRAQITAIVAQMSQWRQELGKLRRFAALDAAGGDAVEAGQ
jgi:hypothetical protein